MADRRITALLGALKEGIEARAIGLFDVRHGELRAANTVRTSGFWDAFAGIDCLEVDWGDWDRELLVSKRAVVRCACSRHFVEAYLIHERWALIVLASGPLPSWAEAVIAHALALTTEMLPAGRGASAQARGAASGTAELGIPTWWSRRRASS